MIQLLLVIYNILVVPLLYLVAIIARFFNPKIRKGLRGRKSNIEGIQESLAVAKTGNPRILIHVSSYGEFLQAKPVLTHLKKLDSKIFIIISFFSPSGYDNSPLQPPIDLKCYLPFDSYFQVKKFISIISPRVAVIVRHDIWPNFVWRLRQEKIPLILIDASIPQKSSWLWWIFKGLNKNLFRLMEAILAISDAEAEKFRQLIGNSGRITAIGAFPEFRSNFSIISRTET